VNENLKAIELYNKWTKEIEKRCRNILKNNSDVTMEFESMGAWQLMKCIY
jgi:hypothetical protein